MDSADADTDSVDATELADSTDSAEMALKGFPVSFTFLLKVLCLLVSHPLSYTWLKREPQISIRKERFIRRYLQYEVLGDYVFQFLVLMYIIIYK